jgi:hypothetical protein
VLERWWEGRQERIAAGSGIGACYVPAVVIDRLFPDSSDPHRVCAANARALFESEAVEDMAVVTFTVHDTTSGTLITDKEIRQRR